MTSKTLTVKELSPEEQPREKLLKNGARELQTHELLAILLRTGMQGKNVIDLSRELLRITDDSLHLLSMLSVPDLMKIDGMGATKAITICAAMELGHRLAIERSTTKKDKILNSADLYAEFTSSLSDLNHEEFWALYCNTQRQVIHKCRIASGGISQTIVDVRLIYKIALSYNATSVAVAHNHPAGSIQPSTDDNRLTRRIFEAGRILSIPLFDHIIIGQRRTYTAEGNEKACTGVDYYSYNDEGTFAEWQK